MTPYGYGASFVLDPAGRVSRLRALHGWPRKGLASRVAQAGMSFHRRSLGASLEARPDSRTGGSGTFGRFSFGRTLNNPLLS